MRVKMVARLFLELGGVSCLAVVGLLSGRANAGGGEAVVSQDAASLVFDQKCAPQTVRFLALEGGGVKGIAYAGAIGALEDAGLLQQVVRCEW